MTNTGEKPYQCNYCENAFNQKTHLVNHYKTHTLESSYQCSHCEKNFSKNSLLLRHLRTHTGEKPFKCSHYDKDFSQNSQCLRHQMIHTGEKPYQCRDCDESFNQKTHLVNHQKTHSGIITPRLTLWQNFHEGWADHEPCEDICGRYQIIAAVYTRFLKKRFFAIWEEANGSKYNNATIFQGFHRENIICKILQNLYI